MRHTLTGGLVLGLLSFAGPARADIAVSTVAELTAAVAAAKPGDTIVLAAGTYAFAGGNRAFTASAAGTAQAPITVRSASPLAARLTLATLEGIVVEGPFWRFEGLDIQGVCAQDSDCEHAFHVVGKATDFVLRGSRLVDFNAQIKVNATLPDQSIPHRGLLEGNEFYDTHGRKTDSPVTKINIDTGDDWVVRANVVRDFFKDGGNGISYGVFLKSGGHHGLVERNLVLCERDVPGGTRIGLSFGGGGTGAAYCAPAFDANVPCSVEHSDGIMRNNIVARCSDVGIYLNRAASTKLLHNTLIDTAGIDFRFETTSGVADGNVLAGKIRDRDGGTHTSGTNLTDVSSFADWYQDPMSGDLRKKGDLGALLGKGTSSPDVPDDYCARPRSGAADLGALQASLGDCVTTTPTVSGAGGMSGGSGQGGAPAAGQGGAPAAGGQGGAPATGGQGGAPAAGQAGKGGAVAAGQGGGVSGGSGPSGASGQAGAASGAGGRSGAGTGSAASAEAGDDDGCGCRAVAAPVSGGGGAALVGLAALLGWRRRQRA